MKLLAPLLTVALLAACSQEANNTETAATPAETSTVAAEPAAPAATADAQSMGMSDAEHQTMDMGATTGEASGTPATASGTVESVDAQGGKIVIAHGPVEALKWPAMTMGFTATPEQIKAVQPGQKVTFDFSSQGSKNTITRIAPAQ
jgi:Cu(I)/Ag(I) efflux system protein CusF